MDRATRKAWLRFLDQATDRELAAARAALERTEDSFERRWMLATLLEEERARAELARFRQMYAGRK